MRPFHQCATVSQRLFFAAKRFQRQEVSREAVLARWNARPLTSAEDEPRGVIGKGMKFASSLSGWGAGSRTSAASTIADVTWDLCERIDFHVQYSAPSNWVVEERVSENSISIQCSPPPVKEPTVHGMSLNCFAYKQRVRELDNAKLLRLFLQRFNASVSNSLEVLSQSSREQLLGTEETKAEDRNICETLARRLDCAVAEITFTPAVGESLAHGLCRAFYNSNRKFHYIVVVAVPAEEFEVSKDLLTHALVAVVESRVEAAAKRT